MRARLPPPGGDDTKRLLRPASAKAAAGRPKAGPSEARGGAAPRHFNRLQRAALAAGYLNGTLGQAQTPGQELDYRPVGPALERRRGHAHAQGAVVHPDDFFPAGSRLHLHPEARAPRSLFHRQAHRRSGRGPKSAVPRRPWVAPPSMATSKSWLIPMESSRIALRARRRRPISSASSRRRRKKGRTRSGGSRKGGMVIRPSSVSPSRAATCSTTASKSAGATPCLVSSSPR